MSQRSGAARARAHRQGPGRRPGTRSQPRAAAPPASRANLLAPRWALLPALLACAVYANSLHNPFVYDDVHTVLRNPSLQDLHNWRWILLYSPFRPVVNVSYALDVALGGLQPFGFHVTSLVLHALASMLFFAFARDLVADRAACRGGEPRPTADRLVPIAAATLFAVHPLLTEAVGYASARPELLCSVFAFAALMLARRAILGRPRLWIAAALCWLLALASRETGAVVPLALLLWDRLLGPADTGARRRRLLRLHLPLVLLVTLGGIARVLVYLRSETAALPRSVGEHFCTELPILWRYLRLLVWPAGQTVVHAAQRVATPWEPRVLLAAAAIVATGVACWMLRRRFPLVVFGVVWFPLFLAPSSSLVPLIELMAEHRAYLASAGMFLAAAVGVGALGERWRATGRRPAALVELALGVVVAALALLTLQRNEIWCDPVTLWGDAVAKAPRTWAPYYALGDALRDRGDCAAAIPVYKHAIALLPGDTRARLNLGACLAQTHRLDEARAELEAVLALDPSSAAAHNDLGMLAIGARQGDEARAHFERAMALDAANLEARMNLAILDESARDYAGALALCQQVEAIRPGIAAVEACIERNRTHLASGAAR